MKLQAIRYFIAVVDAGGLRAATKTLPISQSTLTVALRQLEDELGAPLLHRSKRGVIPTQFGRAFLEHARIIDRESRKAREKVAQLRGHWEGTVSYATSPAISLSIVPPAIRAFRKRFPAIQLRCVDGMYPSTLSALRDGLLDFAIGPCNTEDLDELFVSEPLRPADPVIICRRDHPLRKARALAELRDCEWAIFGNAAGGGIIEQAFGDAGLGGVKIGMICESFMALPGIVALTDMLGVLPRQVLDDTRWREHLATVRTEPPLPAPQVSVLRRTDIPLTPAATELLGWIRHFANQPQREGEAGPGAG